MAPVSRKSIIFTKARKVSFLIWPFVFSCILVYLSYGGRSAVAAFPAPRLISRFTSSDNASMERLEDMLPPLPTTMLQAYKIGQLVASLKNSSSSSSSYDGSVAAKILGVQKPVSYEKLLQIERQLVELESNPNTLTSRVWGFFSFVNFLWLIAIIGIAFTVGPVVYLAFNACGVWQMLYTVGSWVYGLSIYLAGIVVLRFILEPFLYYLSLSLIVDGIKMPVWNEASPMGYFVSLLGCALMVVCYAYSIYIHDPPRTGDTESAIVVTNLFGAAVFFPCVAFHASSLCAFLVVFAFYSIVGFSVIPVPLGLVIGFQRDEAMERSVPTSIVLLLVFTSMRITGLIKRGTNLDVLALPVFVMGCNVLLLALLIMSSSYFRYYSLQARNSDYFTRQARMLSALLILAYIGFTYSIPAISNVVYTFSVLYGLEKSIDCEHASRPYLNLFVVLLAVSIGLYFSASYLSTHPSLVVDFFSMSRLFDTTGF